MTQHIHSSNHPVSIQIEKKIIIRTVKNNWVNTDATVIIPISIHSGIHYGIDGYIKISALINLVKSKTKGKIIILFCEGAHVNLFSLKCENNLQNAWQLCRHDADLLYARYHDLFSDCEIHYWHNYISQHEKHAQYKKQIISLINANIHLQEALADDLEKDFLKKPVDIICDKSTYLEKATLDMIEMNIAHIIMHKNGCRFNLYPGKMCQLTYLLQDLLFPELVFVNAWIKESKENVIKQHEIEIN